MQAAILVIGDEVLAGRTKDTNSHFLARKLERLGVRLVEIRTVTDDPIAIQLAVWELQERRNAELVITSGGLGPTHDDRTVHAVANLHGLVLRHHEETWRRMIAKALRLKEKGIRETDDPGPGAAKVALVPQGAIVLTNSAGAAPGLLLERRLRTRKGTAWTLVLPGVPQELRAIWIDQAEPWVVKQAAVKDHERRATRRWSSLTPESVLAPALESLQQEHPEVSIGSYPRWGTLRVVLSISGVPKPLADAEKAFTRRMESEGFDVEPLKDGEDGEDEEDELAE